LGLHYSILIEPYRYAVMDTKARNKLVDRKVDR
jgi:hypothetical protein